MLTPLLRGRSLGATRRCSCGDEELVPDLDLLTSPRIELIDLVDRSAIALGYAVDGLLPLHLMLTNTAILG